MYTNSFSGKNPITTPTPASQHPLWEYYSGGRVTLMHLFRIHNPSFHLGICESGRSTGRCASPLLLIQDVYHRAPHVLFPPGTCRFLLALKQTSGPEAFAGNSLQSMDKMAAMWRSFHSWGPRHNDRIKLRLVCQAMFEPQFSHGTGHGPFILMHNSYDSHRRSSRD
jgi:hypothetical protein